MRKLLFAIGPLLACSNCAKPPPLRYTHASADQQTYVQDRYVCVQQTQQQQSGAYVNQYGGSSQSKVVTNRGVFQACMGAKGYRVDPAGPLTTPPEAVIMMVD